MRLPGERDEMPVTVGCGGLVDAGLESVKMGQGGGIGLSSWLHVTLRAYPVADSHRPGTGGQVARVAPFPQPADWMLVRYG